MLNQQQRLSRGYKQTSKICNAPDHEALLTCGGAGVDQLVLVKSYSQKQLKAAVHIIFYTKTHFPIRFVNYLSPFGWFSRKFNNAPAPRSQFYCIVFNGNASSAEADIH